MFHHQKHIRTHFLRSAFCITLGSGGSLARHGHNHSTAQVSTTGASFKGWNVSKCSPRAQQDRCPVRFPRAIPQQAAAGCRAQGWDLLWQSQFRSPPEIPASAGTSIGPGGASMGGQSSSLVVFSKPPNAWRKNSCSSPDIPSSKLQGKQIYLNYKVFRNQTMTINIYMWM